MLATCLGKLSILSLYLKMLEVDGPAKWATYLGMVFCVFIYLGKLVVAIIFCLPHSGERWTILILNRCRESNEWQVVTQVLVVALDLFIFIIPIPVLVRLQMGLRKKLGACSVFGIALL